MQKEGSQMKAFFAKPSVKFVAKTLFYTVIILILVYLYSYRGVAGGHFIYNEF
ncbi:teichoic acid D-Ala incorporation-associated protein DltX [Lacticaseibacillus suibinensis]|uniref:teichoic acid D-Ala incorporation-associated protein DltX n=1 Tax=Lacticaseibacillus suibinensis TaxID=2486011 RepID=UPI00384D6C14